MASPVTEEKVVQASSHGNEIDEKIAADGEAAPDLKDKDAAITTTSVSDADDVNGSETDSQDAIIVTGADAAAHLLPLRDDGDPSFTFRGVVIATALSGFQAVMNQIYMVGQSGSSALCPRPQHGSTDTEKPLLSSNPPVFPSWAPLSS